MSLTWITALSLAGAHLLGGHPAWSPDGRRVAYEAFADGASEIRDGGARELYLMDADGRNAVRLTHDAADDADAVWSPASDALVFYSNRRGPYELFWMDLEDTTLQVPLRERFPARPPDASRSGT